MIRILHLLPTSQPGGGPRHVGDLLWNLPGGQFVCAVAAPAGPFLEECRTAQFDAFEADLGRLRWRSWRQTIAAVRQFRPDIIHSHGKGPGLYGRLLARGLDLLSVHTFHGIHPPKRFRHLYLWHERRLARATHALIHVSPSERDEADRLGFRTRTSWLIPNGIDHRLTYEWLAGSLPPLLVGCAARRDPIKRLDVLRQAVDLAGGRLVLPHGRVGELYAFCHVYASASNGEGLPYGILDAMATGLPVVATRVPGHTDLVRDGLTGFLTPPGDARAMAIRLRQLAENEAMRRSMGELGREIVADNFRLEDMVRRTAECYESVLAVP